MTVSPTARPHLPWNIPQRFWDMYPPTEEIDLPLHVSHNQLSSPLCLISLGVLSNALLSLPSFSSVPPSAPHRFSLSLCRRLDRLACRRSRSPMKSTAVST